MQDERDPDIMGPDSEALEEKVREMMDPKAKKIESKFEDVPVTGEVGTAPELVGLPTSKKPVKIKVIKSDPPDNEIAEPVVDIPPAKPKASKKIVVSHDESEQPVVADAVGSEADEVLENDKQEVPEGIPDALSTEPVAENTVETSELETATPDQELTASEKEPQQPVPVSPVESPLPPVIEDNKTKDAVDDIVAKEGDELLAREDEKIAAFQPPKKQRLGQKLKSLISAWWHNPKARWLTFSVLFLAIVAAAVVPTSRYFLLNTAHVRSGMSLLVLDNSTQQPLKNVRVAIGSASGTTETDGRVRLTGVKLGPGVVRIEKRAFAPIEQQVVIGWGSNPLGEFKLVPTGTQYAILVTDYLSGKGVENIEASSGEANALSDKNGKIVLTMEQPPDQIEAVVKGKGFRQENLSFSADMKTEQSVKLVPERKEVFITRRSGVYDVYKIDIDGKNEDKVLAGTGSERDDILLLPHPSSEVVAVVSTRGNTRNKDGFLLSSLTIVDLKDNGTTSPAQSEQIRLLGWVGDRLVYMQSTAGASAANPKRQRLMSYNYTTDENNELFTSNYFNDLGVIGNKIYFAPSGAYQAGSVGLFSLNADGTNRQTTTTQEVWNFTRVSYEHINLSAGQDWYDLRLGDKAPTKLPGQPANLNPRAYVDSPDGKKSLWVDNRDGKGVLLAYEPETQNEQILRTQSGLKNPVRWLSDTVVIYRINTEQETADYALSLLGGEPQKIRDVTHTSGTDNWYYY